MFVPLLSRRKINPATRKYTRASFRAVSLLGSRADISALRRFLRGTADERGGEPAGKLEAGDGNAPARFLCIEQSKRDATCVTSQCAKVHAI